jgi:hypothetical protein
MSDQRYGHTATLLTNGQVLIAGGDNGSATISSADLYAPTPSPIILSNAAVLANGAFQFAFANTPGVSFSVLGSTNPSVPLSNWTALGSVTEGPPGQFQFTDSQATNSPQRFYRVQSP